jgi:5S rRNA maturation endonuclease (ribonuclease M5)/ribosomal protein L37AE/L43A
MNIFEFHTGLEYRTSHSGQSHGTCPFCGSEDKFYFKDTLWDCKSSTCKLHGNEYTFMNLIYERATQKIQRLAIERELPVNLLIEDGWRYNSLNQSFIMPSYNMGKMNNLYKFNIGGKCLSSPGINPKLTNILETYNDEIWIVEGQWDYTAAKAIIGYTKEISVVAAPGSNNFQSDWCKILEGKKVRILYDKDDAGSQGVSLIVRRIKETNTAIQDLLAFNWPDEYPEKSDIRDLYIKKKREAFDIIINNFSSPQEAADLPKSTNEVIVADESCDSFEKVVEAMSKVYHITEDMVDCLCIVLCSIYSNKLGGEQLWLRIIGPPGAGKTTIVNAVSAVEQVVVKSTFTGIFSGFQNPDDSDASLVPLIQNKTLMVKDADALLRQPSIEKIMSELRDFYDKNSAPSYRNGVNFEYNNVRSTFILCGTQALRRLDNSFLGERFLNMELHFTDKDMEHIKMMRADRAILEALSTTDLPSEGDIKAKIKGFVHNLFTKNPTWSPDTVLRDKFMRLCSIIAKMRTTIERNKELETLYTVQPEVPTRLIGQIIKMAICIPVILGRSDEKKIFRIIKKLVLSTIDPKARRFRIMDYVYEKKGMTAEQIQIALDISRPTLGRELLDMVELRLLEPKTLQTSGPGRKVRGFYIHPSIEKDFEELYA